MNVHMHVGCMSCWSCRATDIVSVCTLVRGEHELARLGMSCKGCGRDLVLVVSESRGRDQICVNWEGVPE